MPRIASLAYLAGALVVALGACGGEGQDGSNADAASAGRGFSNVSQELEFTSGGGYGEGGDGLAGLAWFDHDDDGLLDLFVPNGKGFPDALFRNVGDGTFVDVADQAGVASTTGHSGVVAGDLDNDGDQDLFLTGTGGMVGDGQSPTTLYRNDGDGTFTDVSITAGVPGAQTALAAVLVDIDNDGLLDIFVTSPGSFSDERQDPNRLYHNDGDLQFTDISASAGIDDSRGACAAVATDPDRDGFPDILVANCWDGFGLVAGPIQLYRNNGDRTFTDVHVAAGLATPGFWMGFATSDVDHDGDLDFFVTNLGTAVDEMGHALYLDDGDLSFTNVAADVGVRDLEFGWGASFADFDNDGSDDLYFAGSHPYDFFYVLGPGRGNPGRLLYAAQDAPYEDLTGSLRTDLSEFFSSGVAAADFDRDGFPEFAVKTTTIRGAVGGPLLFRNLGNSNHWLTVATRGTTSNRDGVGARVKVVAGDLVQLKERQAGASFASMDSPQLTFGLGPRTQVDYVEITWPSGQVDRIDAPTIDQLLVVTEGEGS